MLEQNEVEKIATRFVQDYLAACECDGRHEEEAALQMLVDVPRLPQSRSNTKTLQYEGVAFEVDYYLEMANHSWELDALELSSVKVGGQELLGLLSQDTYVKLIELLEKSK